MCCGIYSAAHLSLTSKHLVPLLKGVRTSNWWGYFGAGVLDQLGVPRSKQQEILEQCGSDEDKAVEKCIEWWLEHATDVSWRKLIYSLDLVKETAVADVLRQYAKPPSGIVQSAL